MEFRSKSHKVRQPEGQLSYDVLLKLQYHGFFAKKIHGSKFQSGLPDIFASHPKHGQKWIETKMPSRAREHAGGLSPRQQKVFREMHDAGCGIWIVTEVSSVLKVVTAPPNWLYYAGGGSKIVKPMGF